MFSRTPTLTITVEISQEAYDNISANNNIMEEVKIQAESLCEKNSKIGVGKVKQIDISLLSFTKSFRPE